MAETFITAVISFASTNIDDIFVLMILYAQVRNFKGIAAVVAGQYLGIGTLAALSILGALGTQLFPPQWIGLLGLLPVFLGIRLWITSRQGQEKEENESAEKIQISIIAVSFLTIANGADNIGVYIPVFSGYRLPDFVIVLAVFAAMIGLWCCLGFALANHPYIRKKIIQYQDIIVPLVLMALGISILAKNYLF